MRASTSQVSRQRWLSPLLTFARREGELHPYGSPEWNQLPDGSWRKIAAACQVGECWQQWWDDLPTRLEDELRARREWEDAEDARVGAYAASFASSPPFVELARRRGLPLGRGSRYEGWLRWRDDELRRMT